MDGMKLTVDEAGVDVVVLAAANVSVVELGTGVEVTGSAAGGGAVEEAGGGAAADGVVGTGAGAPGTAAEPFHVSVTVFIPSPSQIEMTRNCHPQRNQGALLAHNAFTAPRTVPA